MEGPFNFGPPLSASKQSVVRRKVERAPILLEHWKASDLDKLKTPAKTLNDDGPIVLTQSALDDQADGYLNSSSELANILKKQNVNMDEICHLLRQSVKDTEDCTADILHLLNTQNQHILQNAGEITMILDKVEYEMGQDMIGANEHQTDLESLKKVNIAENLDNSLGPIVRMLPAHRNAVQKLHENYDMADETIKMLYAVDEGVQLASKMSIDPPAFEASFISEISTALYLLDDSLASTRDYFSRSTILKTLIDRSRGNAHNINTYFGQKLLVPPPVTSMTSLSGTSILSATSGTAYSQSAESHQSRASLATDGTQHALCVARSIFECKSGRCSLASYSASSTQNNSENPKIRLSSFSDGSGSFETSYSVNKTNMLSEGSSASLGSYHASEYSNESNNNSSNYSATNVSASDSGNVKTVGSASLESVRKGESLSSMSGQTFFENSFELVKVADASQNVAGEMEALSTAREQISLILTALSNHSMNTAEPTQDSRTELSME